MTDDEINHKYAYHIALGSVFLADVLARYEKDKERSRKKHNVVNRKIEAVRTSFPKLNEGIKMDMPWQMLKEGLESKYVRSLMIDLAFSNPFAPSELKYKQKDFIAALHNLGNYLSWGESGVDRILKYKNSAMKAHRHIPWGKIATYGFVGAMIIGAGGWVIAPALGAYIGTAAGLSGAAAASHGLAILGGGSLAIGGYGMAGGMWIVTGAGVVTGLGTAGGAKLLLELGSARTQIEIIKLQVTYKEIITDEKKETGQSLDIREALEQRKMELDRNITEELEFNEKGSTRIKEMEAIKTALGSSIKWIKEQKEKMPQG
jgi:hypothetical protein